MTLHLNLALALNPTTLLTGSCSRLEELLLDSNEVRELPDSLCALTSLRKISACQNRRAFGLRLRQAQHFDLGFEWGLTLQ